MTHCKYCDKEVKTKAIFNWRIFIGLLIAPPILTVFAAMTATTSTALSGIILFVAMIIGFIACPAYLIHWAFLQTKACPICHMEV